MYNHRGEPTGTNHASTPQAEQFRRTQHPLQGGTGQHVGSYLGSDHNTGTHFFSAESTGGGSTDSLTVHDSENYKAIGNGRGFGNIGTRYIFTPGGHSGNVRPYSKGDFGIVGAPMSDTPADMADHRFQK